jgi:hypothetical protein
MCRNIPYTSERLPITHIKISFSHWAKLDEEVLPAALSYQHDASAREVIGSTNLGMYMYGGVHGCFIRLHENFEELQNDRLHANPMA